MDIASTEEMPERAIIISFNETIRKIQGKSFNNYIQKDCKRIE